MGRSNRAQQGRDVSFVEQVGVMPVRPTPVGLVRNGPPGHCMDVRAGLR